MYDIYALTHKILPYTKLHCNDYGGGILYFVNRDSTKLCYYSVIIALLMAMNYMIERSQVRVVPVGRCCVAIVQLFVQIIVPLATNCIVLHRHKIPESSLTAGHESAAVLPLTGRRSVAPSPGTGSLE